VKLVILGAGGQAREARFYIHAAGHECIGNVVATSSDAPSDRADLFTEEWLHEHVHEVEGFVLGVGSPAARLRIAEKIRSAYPTITWPVIVHPSAIIDRSSVHLADGVMVGAGAIVTVNVTAEEFSMVNFGATVGHDVAIGRGAVINPGANVSGGVKVGEGALIGAGAVILQYLSVGANAIVGAGAVVTRDVPAGATVVGVPARVVS